MNTSAVRSTVTIADLLQYGEKELGLQLVAGRAGLRRKIKEAAINRPGLALSGFFAHFPHRRIQVLGLAECSYLSSLGQNERREALAGLFEKRIPCLIVTRARKILAEIVELAEENRIPVLSSGMITKHFVNAATIVMENLMAPRTKVQGTMVEIMGIGVLIEGKPGLGKSEIALGLIKRGHALVSDDITSLRLDSAGNVMASCVDVTRYHMEIHGLGIIHVPSLFGVSSVRGEKKLELVVSLVREDDVDDQSAGVDGPVSEFFGHKIARVRLPIGPGRNMTNVVETAALNEKLRRLGHDAEKELDEKLMARLSNWKNGSE